MINYPKTVTSDVVDTYFDKCVADPYRWLEDDCSEATRDWITAQNQVTGDYLRSIPFREELSKRLGALWDYEKAAVPVDKGDWTYIERTVGLADQPVMYRRHRQTGAEEVFLDPNNLSDDGTAAMTLVTFSQSGKFCAHNLSRAGSDWQQIMIRDVATGELLEPALEDVKFSGISWRGDEGFYYSSYTRPEGSELSARTDRHLLFFHKLGQPQHEDELVYGAEPEEQRRYVSASVTEDNRYLIISGRQTTSGADLWLRDLSDSDKELVPIVSDPDSDTQFLTNDGSRLLFFTNLEAPNGRVIAVDAANPGPEHWQDVIAETKRALTATAGGGSIFAHYLVDAIAELYQFDYQGNLLRQVELPGAGSIMPPQARHDADRVFFSFTNYHTPACILGLDVTTGHLWVEHASQANFNADDYSTTQLFYASKDGTRVPMFVTHRKGLQLDGSHPTILYGYGGFNIDKTPAFSADIGFWLSLGGVYAVPNLRGGGEYGERWHLAGTLQQKQNVFDDFIAAAESLKAHGYTSTQKLALRGGSNGGLLVGAVMTQRPDLARVALPAVGVLDMLRYHKFTAGAGWARDYGTSEDNEAMFEYLLGYSPLHNLVPGTEYPATLVTTADHDDRVVPAHSFKFAARLQACQASELPALIRIDTNAGHGLGMSVTKQIALQTDVLAFTLQAMGYRQLPAVQAQQ